jgi:signal peptidase I
MAPAFRSHQIALMDTRYAQTGGVRLGDVVVFRHGREAYVKRVYALSGDTVTMVRFSNGICVLSRDDQFIFKRVCHYVKRHPEKARLERIQVPNGCMYVLGDNRTASIDSRDFGAVPVSEVIGRVVSARQAAADVPAHVFSHIPALMARISSARA